MKQSSLALPALCASLCFSIAAGADPAMGPPAGAQQHQVNNESADGGVCRTAANGDYRCRSFVAQATFDADGRYASTRVGIFQLRNTATTNGYRSLECTLVDRSILAVSPNHAEVRALLDADSEACVTYGNIYHC